MKAEIACPLGSQLRQNQLPHASLYGAGIVGVVKRSRFIRFDRVQFSRHRNAKMIAMVLAISS